MRPSYLYNDPYIGKTTSFLLQWRHNDHDNVSNHQPPGCLLNRLFYRRSKKTSKLRVTGLCVGNSPGLVNSPHKGPVTRKMFPFGDVIMHWHGPQVRFFTICAIRTANFVEILETGIFSCAIFWQGNHFRPGFSDNIILIPHYRPLMARDPGNTHGYHWCHTLSPCR